MASPIPVHLRQEAARTDPEHLISTLPNSLSSCFKPYLQSPVIPQGTFAHVLLILTKVSENTYY